MWFEFIGNQWKEERTITTDGEMKWSCDQLSNDVTFVLANVIYYEVCCHLCLTH